MVDNWDVQTADCWAFSTVVYSVENWVALMAVHSELLLVDHSVLHSVDHWAGSLVV